MKVILLRDVAKLGRRYEVVNVPDGLALNKLIPSKDAVAATPDQIKRVENLKKKNLADKDALVSKLKEVSSFFSAEALVIEVTANEQGHLFQGVHAKEVVEAAGKRGVTIDPAWINLKDPIKSVGEAKVTLAAAQVSFELPLIIKAK
jgi:large subunit ribosomal protein L9